MFNWLKNKKKKTLIFLLVSLFVLLGGFPVLAVSTDMFAGESAAFQETTGLSDQSLSVIVGNIINVVLSVLGIVLVILIIYAGITWMTAGGSEEKVKKAKSILMNAGIGLLITVSAWAIAFFVISSLNQAVGDGDGSGGSGSGGSGLGGSGYGDGGGSGGLEAFQVKSIIPSSVVKVRNVKVRVLFNRDLDLGTVNGANIIVENNGAAVAGTVSLVNDRLVEFVPSAPCPEPYQSYYCFDADSDYTVTVKSAVANSDGDLLGADKSVNFTTGSVVDVAGPSATIILPTNYQGVAVDDGLNIQTEVMDDGGVSLVEFFANNNSFAAPIVIDPPSVAAVLENVWLVEGSFLSLIPLQVKVSDIAGNEGQSSVIRVKIRPAHCFNNKLDSDLGETAIDCGGDCGACTGGSCTENEDCGSGFCANGLCQMPIKISSISPDEGKSGNFMTIRGANFSQYEEGKSKVFFINKANGQEFEAKVACVGSWQTDSVVVEVPEFTDLSTESANAFVIKIQSKELCDGQACADNTDNDNGWKGYYVYNADLSSPGLCSINPQSVLTKTTVELSGTNLSAVNKIYFGQYQADQGGTISGTRIDGVLVPNLVPGTVQVTVVNDSNQVSNPVYVKILKSQLIPEIISINPASGAPGQYLYIEGKNFANTIGNVWFSNNNVGKVLADVSFPAECSKDWWNNNFILVKVPNVAMGEYNISVENTQGASLDFPFTVNNQPLSPGICKVDPISGPPSTAVTIYGDGFGTSPMELFLDTQPFTEISSWRDQKIETLIPSIGNGLYSIRFLNSEGIYSNSYNFNVQYCSADDQCDGDLLCCTDGTCRTTCQAADMGKAMYQWKFSTGTIPFVPKVIESKTCDSNLQSPSPWFNSTNSCVNAVISARFNTEMEETSLSSSVKVQDCLDDFNCDCDSAHPCTDVTGAVTIVDTSETNADGTTRAMNGFIFAPADHLAVSRWYKVSIAEGALSKAGNALAQTYSWKFQTRESDALCAVEKVEVLPLNKIIAANQTAAYNTVVKGANCQLLNPADYSFVWSLENNTDNYAEFVAESGDVEFDNYKDILGLKVTPSGYKVEVMCAVSDDSNTYTNKTPARFVVTEGGSVLSVKQINGCSNNVPSPSPARNYENACLNTVVSVQFSAPLNIVDLNNSKIQLNRCNGNPAEEDVTCDQAVALTFPASAYLHDANNAVIGFVAQTSSDLAAGTWYQVSVKGGQDGVAGQVDIDGVVKNIYLATDYTWVFKTGTQVCTLEKVVVSPIQATISAPNGVQDYLAVPFATDCNMIRLSNLKWQWAASRPETVDLSAGTGPTRTVAALQESGSDPVKISASYESVQSSADLYIKFAAPQLSYYYPQCNEACLNSAVGVEFSQSIDLERLGLTLYKCANESCLDYNARVVSREFVSIGDGELIDPSNNRAFVFNYEGNLILNTYYKVVAQNVFAQTSNKVLSNYNVDKNSDGENDAYEWIFKTNASGNLCGLKSVKISPVKTQANFIGAKQEYLAMPIADKDVCNPRGNLLNPYNFAWDWQSSDVERATITALSLNPNLPSYCAGNCLLKGSQSNVILCGNGTVEKGEDCDDSNTNNGDGCARNCLWEGTSAPKCGNSVLDYGEACDLGISVVGCTEQCLRTGVLSAVCGNGKVERGESCDDGNAIGGDTCSSVCLNEGSTVVENICGNGITESSAGEACDDGNRQSGDGCSATCLLEGYSSFTVNGEAICGDGIVNRGTDGELANSRGEACDDGNVLNGDGCSARCLFEGTTSEYCGNGSIDKGEACDDANTANNDGCSNKCLFEGNENMEISCGNNLVELGEDCDDANIYNNDGCSDKCLWEGNSFSNDKCGNNVKDYGEACDYKMSGWSDVCNDQCLLLGGQTATGAVCGNGDLGEGEACDDNNRFDGDGCSSKCLNEGSQVLEGVAVCGNNIAEVSLGEECDDGNATGGDGCSAACLREGNLLASCGNGEVQRDLGEDCDDANRVNGDGCNSKCLNEGASYKYDSVCGNALLEKGEECEAASAGDKISPYQWAVVKSFKADGANSKTSTVDLIAQESRSGLSGSASLVLQCSFESDDQCPTGGLDYGVGKDQCCYMKATITDHLPVQNEAEVCRNPQIQALFDGSLDRGTALMNTTLVRRVSKTDDLSTCQPSEKYRDISTDYVLCKVGNYDLKVSSWNETSDGISQDYSLLNVTLREVLEKNSEYYLVYEDKIHTANGVALKITEDALKVYNVDTATDTEINANVYRFQTGAEVCQVSQLQVMNIDSQDTEPFTLSVAEFSKRYQVLALDQRGKAVVPVAGVYDWVYNWSVTNTDIVESQTVKNSDDEIIPEQLDLYPNNNGLTELFVEAEIINNLFAYSCTNADECSSEQCVSGKCKDLVTAAQKINVFICANPWPSSRLYVNDFFNFSMRYCRDANTKKICFGGAKSGQTCKKNADCFDANSEADSVCRTDISANLPALRISTIIPPTIIKESTGLIREYLFHLVEEKTYCYNQNMEIVQHDGQDLECVGDFNINRCLNAVADGGYNGTCLVTPVATDDDYSSTGDVIGLRVFKNEDNLTPLAWYEENMYGGANVASSKIDGYPAVVNAQNTYVNAVNLVSSGANYDFYSNIYLFTYNEGASAKTQAIYQQLIDSLYFNTNLYRDASYYSWQSFNTSAYAYKQQLIRDLYRLYSFQEINQSLDDYYSNNGSYPKLASGSLIPGISYSTWPSWTNELAMNAVDPINKFSVNSCVYSYGKCVQGGVENGQTCASDRDCLVKDDGSACPGCLCQPSLDNLYNQSTCYNASNMSFDEDQAFFDQADSYVYRYQVLDGGSNYKLDYHLEYLQHVQFSSEGMSESELMGVGQCYAGGTWYEEGAIHPSQSFTFCRLGRWVNSCGNGRVETDLGEQCETSVNMCNENFGNQAWYTPQTKTCSSCLWQGVCSNIPSKACTNDSTCAQTYGMAQCNKHPLINGVSVCNGAGINNGKVCASADDCLATSGTCLNFDDSFKMGRCSLNTMMGSNVWTSNTVCQGEDDCSPFYKAYYCNLASPIACIKNNVKTALVINQNNTTEDCDKCADDSGICTNEKHCVDLEGKTSDLSFFCTDNTQCTTKFGEAYGVCAAVSDGSFKGTCYTQNNENTGLNCVSAQDCMDQLSPSCAPVGTSGFDEADCGGYCGDGNIQSSREVCDWKHPDYYSASNPDASKIYCSNTCGSSCPSGTNKNVFYQGDSYFLRRYCTGTGDSTVDGKSCLTNTDCTATVGGVERQGTCQLDTLYTLNFEAQDGFPSGVNLYLPPCNRLAQGSWTCQSTNVAYLKQGAWCHPDYDEHCVDKNGVEGTCTEAFAGKEPPGFMADIALNNLQAPTLNVVFVVDKSGSMNTYDVSCGDPLGNSGTQTICEYYPQRATRRVSLCTGGQPAPECVAAGVTECKTRDSRFECALDALTNSSTGAIQKLVDFSTENQIDVNMSAVFFSANAVPATSEALAWYGSSDVVSFKAFLNSQVPAGGTYTDLGFEVAAGAFNLNDTILAEADKTGDNILILLTDGDVDVNHKTQALDAAMKMKSDDVSLYTIAYPNAINNTYLWSSECPADENLTEPVYPPCQASPVYAYSSASSLGTIYDEIISRMTVTLTANELSTQLYGGRYMPLPGTYQCRPEAQLLPLNIDISQSLRGNIKLQNLKFNYCP